MQKLIKNLNTYTFDNTSDDNFAIDFTKMTVELKYGIDRQHLIDRHKRLSLEREAKISSAMNFNVWY